VVDHVLEVTQLIEIALPALADRLSDEIGQLWIRLQQPSPRRHSVCLVVELPRIESIEISEDARFENLGMQLRDAVHRMASHDGEIGHPDVLAVDDAHPCDVRSLRCDGETKSTIDL